MRTIVFEYSTPVGVCFTTVHVTGVPDYLHHVNVLSWLRTVVAQTHMACVNQIKDRWGSGELCSAIELLMTLGVA